MPIVHWFNKDLRLHDNEAVYRAVKSGEDLVFVYCIDAKDYRYLDLGFRKADKVRYLFLQQCLADLRNQLKALGGNLLVVQGDPTVEILKLVERHSITKIYAEEEHGEEEVAQIKAIQKMLPVSCTLKLFWGSTLYHKDDIPYTIADIPLVSKTYRIKTTKETEVRPCLPKLLGINFYSLQDFGVLPTFDDGVSAEKRTNEETAPFVEGGELAALKRLQHYFYDTQQLTAYKWTRNKSMGMDHSSKFSAYLALGCISPRYIYHEVKTYENQTNKKYGTWWFIFQLVWRDFFIFRHMRVGAKLYDVNGFKGKKVDFEDSTQLFERWCKGKTGIPFVDAHMRKLNQTGYMSNRGRVNCSSFLIHDYKVDWRWGAAYFESKLIDYDVSVNWMNWHMQAFEIWYTNPIYQSYKYKEQEYIRKWLPEIADLDDSAILIPWESDCSAYPKPIEVYAKWQRSINSIKKTTTK